MTMKFQPNRIRTIIFKFVVLIVGLSLIAPTGIQAAPQAYGGLASSTGEALAGATNHDVIVHLFEWKWTDIGKECKSLASAGYGAVQVSPPQEHREVTNFPVDYWKDGTHYFANANYPWWQRYQPVTYQLNSRSGSTQEFLNMVEACHAVGVKIIADVVINHMASAFPEPADNLSNTGREYWSYWFTDLFPVGYNPFGIANLNYDDDANDQDFHTSWGTPYGESLCPNADMLIHNYNSDVEVWNCELGTQAPGLPDLRTGQLITQKKIATYLTYLVNEMGVDGFRIDAAKHIHHNDIQAILDLVKGEVGEVSYNDLTIFQEVIEAEGQPIQGDVYTDTGRVTEFQYGQELYRVFTNGDLSWLAGLDEDWICPDSNDDNIPWENCLLNSDEAVVFINNHDNQRGHGSSGVLTYKEGTQYQLANIFMLAWPYGTPSVMSSYEYGNGADHQCEWIDGECILHDWEGPPSDANGNTNSIYPAGSSAPNCSTTGPGVFTDGGDDRNGWVCEHRWPVIENMVFFHNQVSGTPGVIQSGGDNQIAIERGDVGFVAINNSRDDWTIDNVKANLPWDNDTLYIDLLHPIDSNNPKFIKIDATGYLRYVDKNSVDLGPVILPDGDAIAIVKDYTVQALAQCIVDFIEMLLGIDLPQNATATELMSLSAEINATTANASTPAAGIEATSSLTPSQVVDILYNFRDKVLVKTTNGKTLVSKYYRYSPNLTAVVLKKPSLGRTIWTVLTWSAPSLDRYIKGRTDKSDLFTTSRYTQIESIYNTIVAYSDTKLASEMKSYWSKIPLKSYVGLKMDDVIIKAWSIFIR